MAGPEDPREICRGAWFARMDGGGDAVAAYLQGLGKPADAIARYQGDPQEFSFNGGSGNWPWVAAATEGDLDWMMQSLAVEKERGLGRCEIGAEVYPERIPAKMWGLKLALAGAPAPAGFVDLMRANLAAEIAAVAIACINSPVARLVQRINAGSPDGGESTGDGNDSYYTGWSSALPSQRSNFAIFLDGLLAPLAAWACGETELKLRRRLIDFWWPLAAAEKVVGAAFAQPTPPEVWGLSAAQREACRAWVHGDRTALPAVLAMLADWHPAGLISIYRTSEGAAGWMGGIGPAEAGEGLQTFKPTLLFRRIDRDGSAWLAMPSIFKAGGASKGESYFDPADGKVFTAADGTEYRNSLPEGELELWLRWGPGRMEVTGAPAVEPPVHRPVAAIAKDLRRLADELDPPAPSTPPAAGPAAGAAPDAPKPARTPHEIAQDLAALARELDTPAPAAPVPTPVPGNTP